MKSMLKDAAILFVITLVAGLLLGVVNEVTKEPIAEQEKLAKQAAWQEVFPEAALEDFTEMTDFNVEEAQNILNEGGYTGARVDSVAQVAGSDGSVAGYVLTVTTHEGYSGDIQFTMGVQMDGTLNGISLLSISETPGLGMQAEEVLKPQFAGKNVEKFSYTKTGATSEDQIDAISGATITTNAVTNGVNAGLYYFQTELKGGSGNE